MPVESQFIAGFDQKLDSRFVIQNHLGLGSILALCCLAQFDQALRVEQRIGVTFES